MAIHFHQAIFTYNTISKHLKLHSPKIHKIITLNRDPSQWGINHRKSYNQKGNSCPPQARPKFMMCCLFPLLKIVNI